jgi:hypothetical protein
MGEMRNAYKILVGKNLNAWETKVQKSEDIKCTSEKGVTG